MIIQEWEGYITEISDTTVTCRLFDLTDPNWPEEEAEFYKDKFHLIKEKDLILGLIIKWYITDTAESVIDYLYEEHERYFTQEQLDEAMARAKIISKKLQENSK